MKFSKKNTEKGSHLEWKPPSVSCVTIEAVYCVILRVPHFLGQGGIVVPPYCVTMANESAGTIPLSCTAIKKHERDILTGRFHFLKYS